jgi:hypothetical protein
MTDESLTRTGRRGLRPAASGPRAGGGPIPPVAAGADPFQAMVA